MHVLRTSKLQAWKRICHMQSISVLHKSQVAVVAVTRGEGQLHDVDETRLTRGLTLALIQDEADLLVIARHLEQRNVWTRRLRTMSLPLTCTRMAGRGHRDVGMCWTCREASFTPAR